MYVLTESEREVIASYVHDFWSDVEVIAIKNAVVIYVNSHRLNFDYPHLLGRYDDPQDVIEAIYASEGWQNRSPVSCRYMRKRFEEAGFNTHPLSVHEAAANFVRNKSLETAHAPCQATD